MEGSQKNIFYVSRYKKTNWFVVEDVLTINDELASNNNVSEMWRSIVLEDNQQFFRDNFKEKQITNYDYSQWAIPDLMAQL